MALPQQVTTFREHRLRSNLTDAQLIDGCVRGEQQAWEQLVVRYQRLIYSVALTLCREPEVAADVFQQVCLELYQRLDEIRKTDSLRPWLVTVARRKAFSYLRSLKPTEPLTGDEQFVEPADRIARIERQHMIEQALKTLPDRCRRLLELLYLTPAGRTYDEVAGELSMPVASVGPTRIRCLNKLRNFFGQ
jgi:RNA polymerase sigma factor (sigma-70 family)